MGWSPVTAVFGQRQTGKTTLLKQLAASSFTFDDVELSESLRRQNENFFLIQKKPILLDEIQKFPPAFDLVKKYVDGNKKPGQLLLTGSVRFSQKKDGRESLTGRTTLWELLPLTTSERLGTKFLDLWGLLSKPSPVAISSKDHVSTSRISKDHQKGGLPGICFLRDQAQRTQAIRNHLATLIERDLPLIRPTKILPAQLLELLRLLVPLQGQQVNYSELARKLRISSVSVKQLMIAFEGLFIIRTIGRTHYFEDASIAYYLDPVAFHDSRLQMQHWIFTELRAQTNYRADEILSFQDFSTRGGAHLPFVVRLRNGISLGFSIEPQYEITEKSVKSIYSFQRRSKSSRGIILYVGDEAKVLKRNIWAIPYHWIA